MGFLEAGTPLTWVESLAYAKYVRQHGIQQFLHTFHRVKKRQNDSLKWGDEIEYHLVEFHTDSKRTSVSLTAPEVVKKLEKEDVDVKFPILSAWRPEFGSWMVEATPGAPYQGDTSDLRQVELNMAMRRYRIQAVTGPNVIPFSIVNYPLLGVGAFTSQKPGDDVAHLSPFSRSDYVPDACISPHPRFGTLAANIRHRRGRKVCIRMPLFPDEFTKMEGPVTHVNSNGLQVSNRAEAVSAATYRFEDVEAVQYMNAATKFLVDSGSFDADKDLESSLGAREWGHSDAACDAGSVKSDPTSSPVSVESKLETPLSKADASPSSSSFIHMDAMAFGMGCCCLQVTFQARDLAESRYLYDQLAVISPLVMALTANAPIWRGRLANEDTRWDVIAASVDCRTPAESGVLHGKQPAWLTSEHAGNAARKGVKRITKSRYSSIDCYISASPKLRDEYNDIPVVFDEEAYASLTAGGVDERLAKHIAHLFIRDPLVIFKERVDSIDDEKSTEHFENIQSTNWRSVRWKPPPPDAANMGWRVELRTMEAQLTDFENAAFTVFIVLLSRVMIFFDLDLYIPLSKVEENFERAKKLEAAHSQRFHFRANVAPLSTACGKTDGGGAAGESMVVAEMSLLEILMGVEGEGDNEFPGLVPLIFTYLDFISCDPATYELVQRYVQFIVGRASGEILTGATWQRKFVRQHPNYKHDSVVGPEIVYDMLDTMQRIVTGTLECPELVGKEAPPPVVVTAELLASLATSTAAPSEASGPSIDTVVAPLTPGAATRGSRMRGGSFVEEVRDRCTHCHVIKSLLENHSKKSPIRVSKIDTMPTIAERPE